MSTYSELYTWLTAQAGIAALVGDRVYPATIPQGAAFPCIRMTRDDNGGMVDFDGQGETIRTDLDLDCVAVTLDAAEAIAAAVRAALKGHIGALGTRYVVRTTLVSELDQFEPDLGGGMFRVSQAWTFWHY